MGASSKQHNRGSRVIAQDIERTYFPNGYGVSYETIAKDYAATIKDLRAELANETARADKATRYMKSARAERDVLKEELHTERTTNRDEVSRLNTLLDSVTARWNKCSAIIRDHVSPAQVMQTRLSHELWTQDRADGRFNEIEDSE